MTHSTVFAKGVLLLAPLALSIAAESAETPPATGGVHHLDPA